MVTWRRPLAEINFSGLEFPRQVTLHRVSSGGCHYTVTRGVGVPKIPTEYLDSVFYLYESEGDAKRGIKAGGTGFIVSIPSPAFPQQLIYTYAVTNWHNCCRAKASVIRLNNNDGTTDIFDYGPHDWQYSPKYDIAALQIPINNEKLGVLIPLETSIVPEDIGGRRLSLGVGDNIFMLGRFIDHDGGLTNRPAARFGNISVMPAPIEQPNKARADAFCLDMHSRTGFSGSPVFVYRTIGDDLDEAAGNNGRPSERCFLKFLGIHFGQFPDFLELMDGTRTKAKGASGMTCVLPAWNILEVLDLPKLRERREKEEKLAIQEVARYGLPPIAEHPKFSFDWEQTFKDQA